MIICAKQVEDESVKITLDLRPSDAINIAVRCKVNLSTFKLFKTLSCFFIEIFGFCLFELQVPIQVNKHLAFNDGMRVEPDKVIQNSSLPDGSHFTELDK